MRVQDNKCEYNRTVLTSAATLSSFCVFINASNFSFKTEHSISNSLWLFFAIFKLFSAVFFTPSSDLRFAYYIEKNIDWVKTI